MTVTREHAAMLNGHEFAYLDSGEGPALLFIHGLTGSQRNWAHLIDALDHEHRVLAPDLFGHGASAKVMGDYSLGAHAATLRDLLDQLGIDRVTLVGHSLSLIHISEPTRQAEISYAVFCLKKKKKKTKT